MRVAMLAAGQGRRLGPATLPPKVLLRFGGRTLLERHVAILRHCGIGRLELVTGYRASEIEAEIERLGARDLIVTHFNQDYDQGAIVSFWTLREVFAAGPPVLFMDGDVLYDQRMIERLLDAPETSFLMDRATAPGDDPVKVCVRDGVLVDFHKRPQRAYDWWGEWVGFCRFAPDVAGRVAEAAGRYIAAGRRDLIYEDAIRDVILAEPPDSVAITDITGLPWIEIDFPEDLAEAAREVFPRLLELPAAAAAPAARSAAR